MAKKTTMLPPSKFSRMSGIPVATLNKWIRDGKIKGEKQSGRWMIGEDQLKAKAVREFGGSRGAVSAKSAAGGKKRTAKPARKPLAAAKKTVKPVAPAKDSTKSAAAANAYTVDQFSAMTYLTEFGVREFLKQGRLKGQIDSEGNWKVSADNLQNPLIQHLIR